MSTTVKAGWLKDSQGNKFAPKTITSQVVMNDGTSLETYLDNLTIGEGGGGVTSWNDLTDRPFYDTNEVFFEWDGDISGITEIITASNGNLYRIADAVPSEKLIGATMRIISDGNERIKVLEEGNISYVTDDFALLYDLMVICYSDNMTVSYGNSTFTVEKAGIYHVDPNSYGVYYAASIKKEGELKKLDSKFLQEPTADDALALLIETGYIEPIADDEGIITDDNNVIYTF